MGNQESAILQTYEAGGDLTANQFRFVTVAADGQVDQTGASNVRVAGIQQDNMANVAGLPVQVQTFGRSKVISGSATVNAGDAIMSDTSGRAILAATSGNVILGVARSDAIATGDTIDMDFNVQGTVP